MMRLVAAAVARRVYALDGQQVTSVEQLAPNAHYLYVRPIFFHFSLFHLCCADRAERIAPARSVCANEPLVLNPLPAALEEAMLRARQGQAAASAGAPAELTAATSRELAQAGTRGSRSSRA